MQYKVKVDGAKLWSTYKSGSLSNQVATLKLGTIVTGSNIGNGILQLTSPQGYSKALWFEQVVITVPNDPPTVTLKHVIDIYSDGSIKVDGNPVP